MISLLSQLLCDPGIAHSPGVPKSYVQLLQGSWPWSGVMVWPTVFPAEDAPIDGQGDLLKVIYDHGPVEVSMPCGLTLQALCSAVDQPSWAL